MHFNAFRRTRFTRRAPMRGLPRWQVRANFICPPLRDRNHIPYLAATSASRLVSAGKRPSRSTDRPIDRSIDRSTRDRALLERVSEVGALKDLRFSPRFLVGSVVLQKYVRDQLVLDIVEAVGRLTWTPARRFRLEHRGELRAGYYADLAVFDLDRIHCHSTLENPNVRSTGVTHVFVNGAAVMRDAAMTEARPGKVLRRRA